MFDFLKKIMEKYRNFDRNIDRDPAIISLEYLNFESSDYDPSSGKLVLVLVESRLLDATSAQHESIMQLTNKLQRFKGDLESEGFFTRFIKADLYHGNRHQDGRTLLAVRSFLRDVYMAWKVETPLATFRGIFAGVILVGAFPEASIVRSVLWKPGFKNQMIGGVNSGDKPYLAIGSELIAPRSEIVLADLFGNWQNLYNENSVSIERILAIPDPVTENTSWPEDGKIFVSKHFDRTFNDYVDFFYVNDADYEVLTIDPTDPNLNIYIRRKRKNPETWDFFKPNPIARPDILVSRINALQVAVNPDPTIQGDDGTKPLDANGYPQSFVKSTKVETDETMFRQDKVLEYSLLCDYFDRNHKFRSGSYSHLPFRVAAIAHPKSDFSAAPLAEYLSEASEIFASPVVQEDATLMNYINWFKEPAVLRHIMAHSSDKSSSFKSEYDLAEFEQLTGGKPFRWQRIEHAGNYTYTPSFAEQAGTANFFLHRTIWQSKILENSGANLIIHGGCEVNSTKGTQEFPYYNEKYATFQNGEGILFYMNGIAIMARAKVFYDTPRGFPGVLSSSPQAKFGQGWKAYFEIETEDSDLGKFENSIQCKKSYFWSIIGDWSVRLNYRQGLGLLNFVQDPVSESPVIQSVIHSDDSWIGNWHFDTLSNVVSKKGGDMDANSIDEFLITNHVNHAMGVFRYQNNTWEEVTIVEKDDLCGGWKYNSSENEGTDKILGFWNLVDPNRKSLLLKSDWGIGILQLEGNELNSIVAKPNGTTFGLWVYDSRKDAIRVIGDLDGDGIDELIVTNDICMGILKVQQDTLTCSLLIPNGTMLGSWLFDSQTNLIRGVADLDGDGMDEILILNIPAGQIGILKLQGTSLASIVVHSNGTDLGGYILNAVHDSRIEDDVISNNVGGIFLTEKNVGVHLLKLENGQMKTVTSIRFGQVLGTGSNSWNFSGDDAWRVVGDITGINRSEILIYNSKGIGILSLHSNGSVFTCNAKYDYGTKMGDWLLEKDDIFGTVQRIVNDRLKTNLLIRKRRMPDN
jgi:hypothetical protein